MDLNKVAALLLIEEKTRDHTPMSSVRRYALLELEGLEGEAKKLVDAKLKENEEKAKKEAAEKAKAAAPPPKPEEDEDPPSHPPKTNGDHGVERRM